MNPHILSKCFCWIWRWNEVPCTYPHWGLPLCFWVSDLNSSLHVGGEV